MRTAIHTIAAIAGAMMLHSAVAEADVRNFFSPQLADARVAFCMQSSDECGKPVADAWCQVNGFDEAVLFQRAEMPSLATLYTDTGALCSEDTCVGFHQIKCRTNG